VAITGLGAGVGELAIQVSLDSYHELETSSPWTGPRPRSGPGSAPSARFLTKGSYLRDKLHRLRARMGAKKPALAVEYKILVAAFHMLQRAVAFADLGADYLDRLDKRRTAKRLVRRLDAICYDVMLRPKAAA
jgi:hypothetical protein